MSQIKELQPKEGVTLLAVKVAPDAMNFRISKGFPDPPKGDLAYGTKLNVWQTGDATLPEGDWQILGKATEIPEEVWQGIVEPRWDYYKNYLAPEDGNVGSYKRLVCDTATESAMSLLEADEVYSVNPYGEEPTPFKHTTDKPSPNFDIDKWQQAQENVGTWLILRKI